jgi:hypothetical protein
MKLTESLTTTVLAALLVLTVFTASPALAAQDDADKRLTITVEEGEDGDTVTVYLESSLPNVAGVDAKMNYNPEVVQFTEAEADELDNNALVSVNEDNQEGSLILSHGVPSSSAVDEPSMTALTFEVVGEGNMGFELVDSETSVYEIVDGEPVSVDVKPMPIDVSTNDLSGSDDGATDSSDAGGDSGESDSTGDSDSSSDSSESDGSDETSSESADEGDSQSADENADSDQSESATEQPSETATMEDDGGSNLVSGVGMLAVVAGFLFAVAMLARDQM